MQWAQAAGPAHLCIQFSAFLFCFSFVSVLAGTRVTIPRTLPPPSPSLPLSASVCGVVWCVWCVWCVWRGVVCMVCVVCGVVWCVCGVLREGWCGVGREVW